MSEQVIKAVTEIGDFSRILCRTVLRTVIHVRTLCLQVGYYGRIVARGNGLAQVWLLCHGWES